ncbi:MAG TPA: hypothetical protein VFK40_05010 [Nitrososphaeraceae archaeon]|nr:hypothetical protein [Nitrososphaeraceae archaeon]
MILNHSSSDGIIQEDELISSHENEDEGPIIYTSVASSDSTLSILERKTNKNLYKTS